jgi:hypothetical protein
LIDGIQAQNILQNLRQRQKTDDFYLGSELNCLAQMVGGIFAGCAEQRRWKCEHFQAIATQQSVKSTRSLCNRQMAAISFVTVLNRASARFSNSSLLLFAICPAILAIQLSSDSNCSLNTIALRLMLSQAAVSSV